MTTGIPILYSECRNGFTEKGICHVNEYIHFSKSIPDSSPASHWADCNCGCCSNNGLRMDTGRPRYHTSRFENYGLALESLRLPMPWLS